MTVASRVPDSSVLLIQLSKLADSAGALRCTRADGSITWQKQTRHAAHFALHDLTHYAVETSLMYKRGFFGLIAAGWDIEDTTGKGKRGALPAEALEVEKIVGLFDSERGSGALWTVAELNEFSPRPLLELEIAAIRKVRGEMFSRWFALPMGAAMELYF